MSPAEKTVRVLLVLAWSGWLAYICFKRAIYPPGDRARRWGWSEVEALNRNPIVRAVSIISGILVLLIGIGVALGK
jgi:hypothetical protein